ncbi:thiamine biosynthesis protein ThiS [Luteipulveratus mongoliensis]|uniref:Thiamine biosynthesis protein ThiS n=1 Tax=Luteipulveratus mongoliensis TaxID=571913 RepID=A0A0K1JPT9_9MICO|nr:thiamine biosynthesis protein ThiS [Luteipulveratus mongoliensis]
MTVRYWAGARAAAGVDEERFAATTVGEALAAARSAHPQLESVLEVASVLVDGVVSPAERVLFAGEAVEVLPPFAGG